MQNCSRPPARRRSTLRHTPCRQCQAHLTGQVPLNLEYSVAPPEAGQTRRTGKGEEATGDVMKTFQQAGK